MKVNLKEYRGGEVKKKERVNLVSSFSLSKKLSDKDKVAVYRDLKVLINSGLTVEESIKVICLQIEKERIKTILTKIYDDLVLGKGIAEALEKTNSFSQYEINAVRIGEETNGLGKVLNELELFFKRRNDLKSQIKTVLTYPLFVLFLTFGVLTFMLLKVVPMFERIFKQFGGELPVLTKWIVRISENFTFYIVFFVVVVAVLAIIHFRNKDKDSYRSTFSKIVLRIPFFGDLIRSIYISRFCQSLNLLLSSKIHIVKSLDLVRSMIEFYPIESTIDDILKQIKKGKSLGESMEKYKVYDKGMVSMIKISEKVNELDVMFNYLSEQYKEEVDKKTKRMGVLMEPIIIILVGGLVGVIMVAMYLPMFDLSKILNSN